MTEAQARSLIAGVGFVLCVAIAAIAWGDTAVHVVLAIGLLWLLWDRINVHDRVDETIDAADLAVGKVEAVENHLSGLETEGGGRHAMRRVA